MRMVEAKGRDLNAFLASEEEREGSYLKGIVPGRSVVDVAAWVRVVVLRRGRRKVEVQPAPSIRRSTGVGERGRGGFLV